MGWDYALSTACLVLQLFELVCSRNQGTNNGVGWVGGADGRGLDVQQCVLSRQIVCLNFEEHYQEIFNAEATFVAYLHITGETRQLHRFEPVHGATGVYRAYYHDYGKGLVYKSKILVLRNTSAPHSDEDTCVREPHPSRIYRRYRFKWISIGQGIASSAGAHFLVSPAAGTELATLNKRRAPQAQRRLREEVEELRKEVLQLEKEREERDELDNDELELMQLEEELDGMRRRLRESERALRFTHEELAAKTEALVLFHIEYARDPSSPHAQHSVSAPINLHLWRLKHALRSICFFGDSVIALCIRTYVFHAFLCCICMYSCMHTHTFSAYIYRDACIHPHPHTQIESDMTHVCQEHPFFFHARSVSPPSLQQHMRKTPIDSILGAPVK